MRSALFSAAALAIAATAAPDARAADPAECREIAVAAQAARGDIAALGELQARADACDGATATYVSGALGGALFNAARTASEAERLSLLKRASTLRRDWRIYAALGEEQARAGDHGGAALSLQSALVILQESPPDPPPPAEAVEKLIAMANVARATAPVYTRALRTRSNEPGGVAAERVAGVEIEAVPFPIEFVFGETTLTEDGAFAVEDLGEIVSASAGAVITLAGHTDPVGSDAANRALSLRRAEAVRDILLGQRGLNGVEIRTIGCGETSKPRIDQPEFYSEAEIHQIMRRVELVRSGEPCK